MSRQTFVFDSRFPVSDTMSESDPAHPRNIARNAQIAQNQSIADTRYDIYPPPRVVEKFQSMTSPLQSSSIYTSVAIAVIIVGFILIFRIQSNVARAPILFAVVYSIHYLAGKLENRTV